MPDWARIREEYLRSSIDWERLNAYAAKVAREAGDRHPSTPNWVLDSRFWRHTDKTPRYVETERYDIRYLLERNGALTVELVSWSEIMNPSYWETPKETSSRSFTDADVMLFDYERSYYSSNVTVTDRDPGKKLLVHSKGIGLSKRLKALLEG